MFRIRLCASFILIFFAFWCVRAQSQVLNQKTQPSDIAFTASAVLNLSTLQGTHQLQSEAVSGSEQIRSTRYDKVRPPLFDENHPERSDAIRYSTHVNYENYDPLPVRSSDLIVSGLITDANAHISRHGTGVYSTYNLSATSTLKGTPQRVSSLQIERAGGLVKYPSGQVRFEGNASQGLPVAGHKYLLFLKSVPNENGFVVISGFCIDSSHVTSLDAAGEPLDTYTAAQLIAAVTKKLGK